MAQFLCGSHGMKQRMASETVARHLAAGHGFGNGSSDSKKIIVWHRFGKGVAKRAVKPTQLLGFVGAEYRLLT